MCMEDSILKKQQEFFNSGETRSIEFRKEQLSRIKEMLQENEEALSDAVYKDFKKPPFETFATEIGLLYTEINFAIKNLDKWAQPLKVPTSLVNFPSENYILNEPYGSALIISPWNYPIQLTILPLVGAIAAGNTAVLKPSELTPHTSALLQTLVEKYFKPELVTILLGGPEVSQQLLALPFNYIFFTGSTRVGKIVMQAAVQNLTPVTLELGGKSPCIVDETSNLEVSAKRIVWGKFLNAGQTCVAPDYLYVHSSIKEEILGLLKNAITELYGENPKESEDFARVINNDHFNRLAKLISKDKISAGGEVDSNSNYIAPTILENISWDDAVMKEEIFGPILPVLEFENLDDCIKIINSKPRPLACYIFSNNDVNVQRILNEVSFGGGAVNDCIVQFGNHHLSIGGVGASGFGSYHGKASFDSFSHQKSVMKKAFWPDIPIRYAPYNDKLSWLKKILK